MIIKSITLNNYRLYEGINTIEFTQKDGTNLYLISGENGFGKTTFLHSLIWCLYGRMCVDVDEIVRRDVANNGYLTILKNNLNFNASEKLNKISSNEKQAILKNGYNTKTEYIKQYSQYYVCIEFSEVTIPVIPCKSLKIIRSYDSIFDKEEIEIFIDGQKNELTKEIGPDIFINDFILNRDIARFFFFDSEQIVSLAETNTIPERRRLCSAYNEVLGVRKYEELKRSIDNLRIKLRKKSKDIESRNKLISYLEQQEDLKAQQEKLEKEAKDLISSIEFLKKENEDLQVQIMREGNNATRNDISRIKSVIATAKEKDEEYKKDLKKFLDYAPFAISGSLFEKAKNQVVHDYKIEEDKISASQQNKLIDKITSDIKSLFDIVTLTDEDEKNIKIKVDTILTKYKSSLKDVDTLMSLSKDDYKEILAIYNFVTTTYKSEFERLADDYRKNKIILDRNSRQLSNILSKESDEIVKSLRFKKNDIENQLKAEEERGRLIHLKIGEVNQSLTIIMKSITQLSKKVSVEDNDVKKDQIAEELSSELNCFLVNLKKEKKYSLERRIKSILNNLMHKEDFIGRVNVSIMDDDMDIELYSTNNQKINKDTLSKGEQQLYATSILKALVDESGIQFPVFIDSPLQKFDKSHAAKIITEFYPQVSKQVILFPLLYKELTKTELNLMLPLVNSAYLIMNGESHSFFKKVEPKKLMV